VDLDRTVQGFVAVGSNIEPERNIPAALERLAARVHVVAVSTHYRTEPVERPEQPPFVNGVWMIETRLSARELKFDVLRPIEAEMGRRRTQDRFAPRPIDLDVVVHGDSVVREPDLVVPDPEVLERPFLAVPIVELAPHVRLPGTDLPLAEMPVSMETQGLERLPALTALLRERLGV